MFDPLSHPNIAHVLDAGATDDGLPFVVMEYVDGTTIDEHFRPGCSRADGSVL